MSAPRLRLGVYADLRYEPGPSGFGCDTAFARFIAAIGRHTDELVVFGRLGAVEEPVATLGRDEADFVALPDYPSLADATAVARAVRPSRAAWRASLDSLDALLVFGPHPLGLTLVRDARRRGIPVVLGVRQDLPGYLGPRASAATRPLVLAAAHALERVWRHVSRSCPTVVTGTQLAGRYHGAQRLLDLTFSLVDDARITTDPVDHTWSSEVRVLSVGRLDPEKNPLLLADIAAGLRDAWSGWRVRVVGSGSLEGELTARRHDLAVDDHLELAGSVPHGDALWDEYAGADVLLHVSHTEGQPQVILEAMAAGLPVVATAVGGVASLLGEGERGLLVPRDDANAAITALERLRNDGALRSRLVAAGLGYVREHTIDAEAARLAAFVGAAR